MENTYYSKFCELLRKMFMMDHADLDFGIYRIMNMKSKEINNFLDEDLLPEVNEILAANVKSMPSDELEQLHNLEETAKKFHLNLSESPEYKALKDKQQQSVNLEDLQSSVFSYLLTFFSRYYKDGDFISQMRYKGDNSYIIPYNGEETRLCWATEDQYYIKSGTNLQNYSFILSDGRKVRFVLLSHDNDDNADELNDDKNMNGKQRRFELWDGNDEHPVALDVVDGELHIYFKYVLKDGKEKQEVITDGIESQLVSLLKDEKYQSWGIIAETKDDKKSLLRKNLDRYTEENKQDYFIHKNLGGFLNRELDFFIKNEVLSLDDISASQNKRDAEYGEMRAIKAVGGKIIEFLSQLENFQKKLWEKKKFVISCDYCVTLDRIPESFYAEICQNDKQRQEWVEKFKIDTIKDDLVTKGYTVPLTIEFLQYHPYLVLDTKNFNLSFKHRLIEHLSENGIDNQCNGLLVNSENYQGMNLLRAKYDGAIGAVITDPPYNTGEDDFLYKDNYPDASWLSMMNDRMDLVYDLMADNTWCSLNINDIELYNLMELMKSFGWSSETNITIKMSHLSGMKMSHKDKKIPKIKESLLLFSKGNECKLNPIYEPCSWDEAFDRYKSYIEYNGSENPKDWTKTTVREAAINKGVEVKNLAAYDAFRIKNADKIFRTAVNDSLKDTPHDGMFRKIVTSTGLEKLAINGEEVLFAITYMKDVDGSGTMVPVQPKGDIWTDIGINNAHNEGGVQLQNGKKPVKLYERLVDMMTTGNSVILDPFAGSATTAHAVIECNKNGANNKYILLQSGEDYFNAKTKQRVENVIYSSEWKLDTPVKCIGVSQCFKYIRLEQYEETLNNLITDDSNVSRNSANENVFGEYMLRYMLDTETGESLLNAVVFYHPFDYQLKVTVNNENVHRKVDLVETFNYLIGLNVEAEHWFEDDNICTVEGSTHEDNERTLIIWRNYDKIDNTKLNGFFKKQNYDAQGKQFDTIYVNCDNMLLCAREDKDRWVVKLIEEEFINRMFD